MVDSEMLLSDSTKLHLHLITHKSAGVSSFPARSKVVRFNRSVLRFDTDCDDFNSGTHLSTMSHCATFLMKEHPDLPFIDFEGGTRFSEPPAISVITPTHGRKGLKQDRKSTRLNSSHT